MKRRRPESDKPHDEPLAKSNGGRIEAQLEDALAKLAPRGLAQKKRKKSNRRRTNERRATERSSASRRVLRLDRQMLHAAARLDFSTAEAYKKQATKIRIMYDLPPAAIDLGAGGTSEVPSGHSGPAASTSPNAPKTTGYPNFRALSNAARAPPNLASGSGASSSAGASASNSGSASTSTGSGASASGESATNSASAHSGASGSGEGSGTGQVTTGSDDASSDTSGAKTRKEKRFEGRGLQDAGHDGGSSGGDDKTTSSGSGEDHSSPSQSPSEGNSTPPLKIGLVSGTESSVCSKTTRSSSGSDHGTMGSGSGDWSENSRTAEPQSGNTSGSNSGSDGVTVGLRDVTSRRVLSPKRPRKTGACTEPVNAGNEAAVVAGTKNQHQSGRVSGRVSPIDEVAKVHLAEAVLAAIKAFERTQEDASTSTGTNGACVGGRCGPDGPAQQAVMEQQIHVATVSALAGHLLSHAPVLSAMYKETLEKMKARMGEKSSNAADLPPKSGPS